MPTNRPSTIAGGPAHQLTPVVVLLAPGGRDARLSRCATHLPACLLPPRRRDATSFVRSAVWIEPTLVRSLSLFLALSLSWPKPPWPHYREPPWPATPSVHLRVPEFRVIAASSPPSQASPYALQCRLYHLLLPRAPKAANDRFAATRVPPSPLTFPTDSW